MSKNQKLIPVLVCQDIPAEHDFLVDVLGFSSGGIHRDGSNQVVHAEVTLGDSVIWLHRVTAEFKLAAPRSLPAASSGLFVYVADVDAHYERARSRGAQLNSKPTDMPYGQREYRLTDPEGHRWWFATPVDQRVPQ